MIYLRKNLTTFEIDPILISSIICTFNQVVHSHLRVVLKFWTFHSWPILFGIIIVICKKIESNNLLLISVQKEIYIILSTISFKNVY